MFVCMTFVRWRRRFVMIVTMNDIFNRVNHKNENIFIYHIFLWFPFHFTNITSFFRIEWNIEHLQLFVIFSEKFTQIFLRFGCHHRSSCVWWEKDSSAEFLWRNCGFFLCAATCVVFALHFFFFGSSNDSWMPLMVKRRV